MKPYSPFRSGSVWTCFRRSLGLATFSTGLMLTSTAMLAEDAPSKPLVDFFISLTGAEPETTAVPTAISNEPATHRQHSEITIKGQDGKGWLQSFCVDNKGRLIAVVGANNPYGAGVVTTAASTKEVQIFGADGKQVTHWKVDFDPQRVAVAPNDEIYVAGNGRVARFDSTGKKLDEQDAPHIAAVLSDPEEMKKNAIAERDSRITSYKEAMKNFDKQRPLLEERIAKIEAQLKEEEEAANKAAKEDKKAVEAEQEEQPKQISTDDEKPKAAEESPAGPTVKKKSKAKGSAAQRTIARTEPAPKAAPPVVQRSNTSRLLTTQLASFKRQLSTIDSQIKLYERVIADQEKRTPEDFVTEITQRLKKITAIAVTEKDVFITTGVTKGYGFAVWRATRDLKEGKEIIAALSGCCGQMDVQARGDELFVAENTRHRVGRYDRDGKQLTTFGKNEREGAGGCFGGCCNPMNVCFGANGVVLTAESEGKVKAFQADGTYLGLVGLAKVVGGCKNVTIASTQDGDRIYFYDLQASRIVVLAREETPSTEKKTEKTAMKE